MWGHHIKEKDCGFWPTATTNDATGSQYAYGRNKKKILKLTGAVKFWPTSRAHHGAGTQSKECKSKKPTESFLGQIQYGGIQTQQKGQLNPDWVEWLMGWPIEWTDLKPLAMGRFQQWLSLHGKC